MWKIVLAFLACGLIKASTSHEILENTAEAVIYEKVVASKIASGVAANKTLKTDYALLSVIFINQAQICGGTLVSASWILTSATCLSDPVEGTASYVYVALGGGNKPTLTHQKIVIHPDYTATNYLNDIAMLKLTEPAKVDGKKIILATLATDATADAYVDKTMVYCGWGTIANKPTPPRGLQCTTLFGVATATCGTNANTLCTKWVSGSSSNVCPGDFGGPLYLISGTTQTVVGIASYSADIRPAAPCFDGHSVTYSQVGGFADFITETLAT